MAQAALPGHFEPIASLDYEAATWGYKLFHRIRSGASGASSPTLLRTLELMVVVLQTRTFEHPMPPGDMDALLLLAEQHDWEGCYEREQAEQDLGPEDRQLREHLLWLRTQLPGYQTAIEHLTRDFTTNGYAVWDDARVGEKIWGTYLSAVKEADALESKLRARIDAHKQSASRARRINEIFSQLLGHYAGRGPQYDLVCRTLATVTADIEAARRPGVQATQEGVDALQKLVVLQQSLVNQLQKFTESTKVDSTSGEALRDVAEAVATCALRRLISTQPQMAMEILDDMHQELLSRGVSGVQPKVPVEITAPKKVEEAVHG